MNMHYARSPLAADVETVRAFLNAIFAHADDGTFIALRAFRDNGKHDEKAVFTHSVRVGSERLAEEVTPWIIKAANWPTPAVFCPPIATFTKATGATTADLANGVALSVECDSRPSSSLARLTAILGPPTVTAASGGEWLNLDTGGVEPKLHLHWRMNKPTRDTADHERLYTARLWATRIVGADATGVPLVHPFRWPGSWHRKAEPRLAKIVRATENEIDLADALERLKAALPAGDSRDTAHRSRSGGPKCKGPFGFNTSDKGLEADDAMDVVAALAAIGNADLPWDGWNKIGMAIWAATAGKGFAIFDTWSQKSAKYDAETTRGRWKHYETSPPNRIGAGTLFFMAREARSGWSRPSEHEQTSDERRNATGPDEALDEAVNLDGGVVTHDGVARVFAKRFAGKLRFCHHTGGWYEWTATHWRRDERERAFRFVRELGREMSEGEKAPVMREVRKVQFAAGVEKMARGDEALAVTSDRWDADPYLLGTPGGTVDLRTGELRPADPTEGITKLTAVAPAETADCPRWLNFLAETFGGDADLTAFMQRWCGYSLTGDTREHALVFGSGSGGNGKSVLVNTVSGVMGGYATTAAMDTFTASDWDRHPTELARLRGARLVSASETEEGRVWAEARIKQLTGGDVIAARYMRQDFFEFRPTFKLFIIGNHRPSLRNVDDAMRRRLNIVAFNSRPVVPDHALEEKLRAEWPGILRWMIDGCLAWQAGGLKASASVRETTDDYFDAQDTLSEWLEAKCIVEPENDFRKATTKELFDSWAAFARAANEAVGTERTFTDRLLKQGLRKCKSVPTFGGPRARGFFGIELRPDPMRQREAA